MKHKVIIFDTSILCCWLKIPGMSPAQSTEGKWTHEDIQEIVTSEESLGSTFVLPLASIIETGNHITQSATDRFNLAKEFMELVDKTVNEKSPWAAFTNQAFLWGKDNLNKLSKNWPKLASEKLSIGDATIKDVAEFYSEAGCQVTIFTSDSGLKAYEPRTPNLIPRRRN